MLNAIYGSDDVFVPGSNQEQDGYDRGNSSVGLDSPIASFSPTTDVDNYIAAGVEIGWTSTLAHTVTVATNEDEKWPSRLTTNSAARNFWLIPPSGWG